MNRSKRYLSVRLAAMLLSCLIGFQGLAMGQAPSPLRIIVIEGADPTVEVRDDNDRPVTGARLTFSLPESGPSGTFFGSGTTLSATTNEQGRATAAGLRPNSIPGRFQIRVTAVHGARTGTASIVQNNVDALNAVQGPKKKFWQRKVFAVIVAGAIAGAVIATRGGDENTTTVPGTTITPGTVSVGTPR
jgi:hypothetical protein